MVEVGVSAETHHYLNSWNSHRLHRCSADRNCYEERRAYDLKHMIALHILVPGLAPLDAPGPETTQAASDVVADPAS